MCWVWRLAEQTSAEISCRPNGLKRIRRKFLGYQSDAGASLAIIFDDIKAIYKDLAFRWVHDPADDADKCRLASPVGSEEGKYFTCLNVEID